MMTAFTHPMRVGTTDVTSNVCKGELVSAELTFLSHNLGTGENIPRWSHRGGYCRAVIHLHWGWGSIGGELRRGAVRTAEARQLVGPCPKIDGPAGLFPKLNRKGQAHRDFVALHGCCRVRINHFGHFIGQ